MSNSLTPNNSTSYLGVRATTPPQMIVMKRAPTENDVIGYVLGTQWLQYDPDNPTAAVQYVLSSVEQRVATWVALNQGGDRPILPDYSVVLGTGVPGFGSTSPNATIGQPLVSTGANSNPVFGTASVSGGGTGLNDCDPYSVYCGGTTGEGPMQQVAGLGSAGQVLTSQGNGSLPTWSSAGAGGAGGPIAVQVFTSGSGTCTFTAGMGSCIVEIVGGGAGGATASGGVIGANGGGAGGYVRKFYLATTVGVSQAYSVGAGGATDTVGGNTTFGAGGTLITGSGGAASAGTATPGIGGAASGGDINVQGGPGGISIQSGAVANGSFSGCGGASIYGNGAPARGESTGVGNVGTVYGSGGGGGVDLTGAGSQAGGAGASGIVIVTEFGPYGVLPPVSGTTINIIVYDTPGAGVYTPTANMNQAIVECVGGGGGATAGRRGGGGGGGYTKRLYSSVEIGASKPYVVGTAGLGQLIPPFGPQSASAGGATTFGTGGTLITAGGGQLAVFGTNNPGGAGGTATGGNINIVGQNGGIGNNQSSNNNPNVSGTGGNSIYGFGGPAVSSTVLAENGTGYGGGAGGNAAPSSVAANGSAGVIIITEYIS